MTNRVGVTNRAAMPSRFVSRVTDCVRVANRVAMPSRFVSRMTNRVGVANRVAMPSRFVSRVTDRVGVTNRVETSFFLSIQPNVPAPMYVIMSRHYPFGIYPFTAITYTDIHQTLLFGSVGSGVTAWQRSSGQSVHLQPDLGSH